jgi:hypothetical protein
VPDCIRNVVCSRVCCIGVYTCASFCMCCVHFSLDVYSKIVHLLGRCSSLVEEKMPADAVSTGTKSNI